MAKKVVRISKSELKYCIHSIVESLLDDYTIKRIKKYEKLNENLNNCINEEYGISFDVELCYGKAKFQIEEDLKNVNWEIDEYGIRYKRGCVYVTLYKNEMIEIDYTIYNFITEENYEKKFQNYKLNSYSYFEESKIELNSAMFNGQLDIDTFNDSLQHEISHFYEFIRRDCLPPLRKDKDIDLYNRCLKCIQSEYEEIQTLGYALYASYDSEQIGYINGLDAFLKEHRTKNKSDEYIGKCNRSILYRSDAYSILQVMYDSLPLFDKYSSVIPKVFKISSEKCKKIVNKGINSFTRKISRVVYKNCVK